MKNQQQHVNYTLLHNSNNEIIKIIQQYINKIPKRHELTIFFCPIKHCTKQPLKNADNASRLLFTKSKKKNSFYKIHSYKIIDWLGDIEKMFS